MNIFAIFHPHFAIYANNPKKKKRKLFASGWNSNMNVVGRSGCTYTNQPSDLVFLNLIS